MLFKHKVVPYLLLHGVPKLLIPEPSIDAGIRFGTFVVTPSFLVQQIEGLRANHGGSARPGLEKAYHQILESFDALR